jgi:hypothetical protein
MITKVFSINPKNVLWPNLEVYQYLLVTTDILERAPQSKLSPEAWKA